MQQRLGKPASAGSSVHPVKTHSDAVLLPGEHRHSDITEHDNFLVTKLVGDHKTESWGGGAVWWQSCLPGGPGSLPRARMEAEDTPTPESLPSDPWAHRGGCAHSPHTNSKRSFPKRAWKAKCALFVHTALEPEAAATRMEDSTESRLHSPSAKKDPGDMASQVSEGRGEPCLEACRRCTPLGCSASQLSSAPRAPPSPHTDLSLDAVLVHFGSP